jgi:hypothetical protein
VRKRAVRRKKRSASPPRRKTKRNWQNTALNACGYSFLWLAQRPLQHERSPQGRGYSFFAADTAATTVDRSLIISGL